MQSTFRLSAFSFHLVIALGFLLSAFISSCGFNPNKQKTGQSWIQGEWQQDSVPAQKRLLTYSLYNLQFSCDSFFVKIESHSRVNTNADSCTASGKWTEYWKGTYEQRHDTLRMKGEFCKADKSVKDEKTCLRWGTYEEYFKITRKADSLVQFASISNVIPIDAHLIKTTSCVPKPL